MKERFVKNIMAGEKAVSKKEASELFKVVLDTIEEEIKETGKAKLVGIGTLKVATLKASEGVVNGTAYKTPERKTLKFSASKVIKEKLN